MRIHQQHLEPLRKNVPHRLPVHPGGFHGHMGYAALLEPIGQLQQIVSECPEALLLSTALPLGLSPQHTRSEEHTSELQSRLHLVCRLLLEKKKHSSARHGPAHSRLTTDTPRDTPRIGKSISPTALLPPPSTRCSSTPMIIRAHDLHVTLHA